MTGSWKVNPGDSADGETLVAKGENKVRGTTTSFTATKQ